MLDPPAASKPIRKELNRNEFHRCVHNGEDKNRELKRLNYQSYIHGLVSLQCSQWVSSTMVTSFGYLYVAHRQTYRRAIFSYKHSLPLS